MARRVDTTRLAVTTDDTPQPISSFVPPKAGLYHLQILVLGVCEDFVDRMRSLMEVTLFYDGETLTQEGSEYHPIPETKTDDTWSVDLELRPNSAVLFGKGAFNRRIFWKTAFCVYELGVEDE
jgi:hypothetical protein